MRFSLASLVAGLSALASLAAAQGGPNSIDVPSGGIPALDAGKPHTFTWSNKQGKTVTITLRSGPGGNLAKGTVIADHVSNDGSFTFTPPKDTPKGDDYAIEITDDDDTSLTNFSPQFSINSDATAVSSSSASASSASSASSSASASSSSASVSSSSASSASSKSSESASSSKSASSATKSSSTTATKTSSGSVTATSASSSVTSVPTGAAVAHQVFVPGALAAVALGVAAAL